jgi:hypothetical protein
MARRRPINPLAPLTPAQIRAQASAELAALLLPGRQEVARSRKRLQQQAADEARRAQGLSQALAELQRGVGPATNQAYQAAATTQGGLAQGFTGAMRSSAEADAKAAGELLTRLGAPTAQINQVQNVGQGAADHAYALGGYIPGQSLAREGAAFSAAQNQLPATTLGRGQQQIGSIEKARRDRERELDDSLRELMDKVPGLRGQITQRLLQNEQAKAATQTQRDYLGLAGDKFALDQYETVAGVTGVDPVTGLPTAASQAAAAKGAGKQQAARSKSVKAREDAFTATRGESFGRARQLFKGEQVDNPAWWKDPTKPRKIVKRPTYASAYQSLWDEFGPPLLRYASGSGRASLKKRINRIIELALRNAGFRPAPAKRGPKSTNVYRKRGDRPG